MPLWLLFLFVQPFWEAQPPAAWSDAQVQSLLVESPWAQSVGPAPPAIAIFATAAPIEQADAELRRRRPSKQTPDIDYLDYVKEHRTESFVLAIPYADLSKLGDAAEGKRLEQDSVMRVGRKKIKM